MRCAASSASGCRGVVARQRPLGVVQGSVGFARGAVPLGLEDLALDASQRRLHEVQPPPVQVEPSTCGIEVPGVEREPRRKVELDRHLTHQLAGLARGTNLRRLVHAPPRCLGIPLRPGERPKVQGAHAREVRKVRYILLRENLARLAPSPFQHQQRDPAYRGRFGFTWPPCSTTHLAVRSAAAATSSRSARSSA